MNLQRITGRIISTGLFLRFLVKLCEFWENRDNWLCIFMQQTDSLHIFVTNY